MIYITSTLNDDDDLHFLHTQNCCRINPHGATVSFTLLCTPVFPRVKYGVFKNLQKILIIKIKSFFLVPKDAEFFTLYKYTE